MLKLINKIFSKIKSDPIYGYIFLYFSFLLILSLFRNANGDETYYIRETALIAELLKNGIWIGDYGVGLHGFLFKLPVAISFIILGGPSIFVSTLFTILINVSSIFLFYKIVTGHFFDKKWGIISTILFSAAFHFIDTSISFNRDIPAVFTVLLFLYLFLKNRNSWLIGVSLLLMLDAKEHVFFTIAPFYGVYVLIKGILNIKKDNVWESIKDTTKKLFSGYFLSLIWIILMFTTSAIPVNMFVASIAGLTEIGQGWNKNQFSLEEATKNLMGDEAKEIPKLLGTYKIDCSKDTILCKGIRGIDTILEYIGKILYPRTFSFISIPKIIIFPAIIQAVSSLIAWWKKKDQRYILPVILFFNILIIILRVSHGRYLLGITPLAVIFFILFIRDGLKNAKYSRNILLATTVFTVLGLFFESTFVELKIILEISLLILFWAVWLFRNNNKKPFYLVKYLFLSALIAGMFLTVLAYSFAIGQLSKYIKYGYNMETEVITKEFKHDENILINNYGSGDLIYVYRKNYFNEPQWYWNLADYIPKKNLLKIYSEDNTFLLDNIEMKDIKNEIRNKHIDKVVLVASTIDGEEFSSQKKLKNIQSIDELKLKKKVKLKNKVMYIYEVRN